jgi:hypothetical protein
VGSFAFLAHHAWNELTEPFKQLGGSSIFSQNFLLRTSSTSATFTTSETKRLKTTGVYN